MMVSSEQFAGILPGLPIALPLAGAALLASVRSWLSRAVADSLGILFAALALVIDLLLLNHALHGAFVYWFGNWYPRGSMVLGIGFVIEPAGGWAGCPRCTAHTAGLDLFVEAR